MLHGPLSDDHRSDMYKRLLSLACVLILLGPTTTIGQSLDANGTVTEISGDRVIVEHDTSVAVTEGAKGRVFVSRQIGSDGRQDIIAGVLRVETVSGPLVIGRLTDRSNLVDVATGQHVSFQAGTSGGVGGTLAVRSTPSGASVRLVAADGASSSPRNLGATPVRDSLSSGRYTVTLTKDGYRPIERTIRIRPGADRTVETSLERRDGLLVVRPTPDTASIFVDGERRGKGALRDTLSAGEHRVRVEASGFVTAKDTVHVAAAKTRSIQPSLKRRVGTLKVRSEPEGAVVYLDGSKVGKAPVTKTIETGRHPIRLTKENYKAVEDTVQVRGGKVRVVDIDLQRHLEIRLARAKGPAMRSELKRIDNRLQIRYALPGTETAYDVELQFSDDGGKSYREIDRSNVRGDVGDEISPGQNKEIRWDALQDFPRGLVGDRYRLRLEVEEPFTGGFTIELLTPSNDLPSFGGGVLGWTTKNGYFVFSYSRITRFSGFRANTVNSIGLRAGPVWRLGWVSVRPVFGPAIRGGDFVTQGGSSVYIGRSFYVGTKVLYSLDFGGGSDWGAYLTMGVAL